MKARTGEPAAQRELATILASGNFGEPNLREAFKWYWKAAEAGDTDAQYNLGLMYVFGEGVKKDPIRGLHWLKLAAANGNDIAEEVLGQIYENGSFGIRRNARVAVKWYKAAASHGNGKAKLSLGAWYLARGSPMQKRQGLKLVREAARARIVGAQSLLNKETQQSGRQSNSPKAK